MIDDCIRGLNRSIYSPPFYLSPNGYRMRLRLFINGDGTGKGTHMSLFFVIMPGDHDNHLKWPFQYPATFSIVDQAATDGDQQHVEASFLPNSHPECFQKPDRVMNTAIGIPKFFPLETFEIHANRHILNDTMYIRFVIDLIPTEFSN